MSLSHYSPFPAWCCTNDDVLIFNFYFYFVFSEQVVFLFYFYQTNWGLIIANDRVIDKS